MGNTKSSRRHSRHIHEEPMPKVSVYSPSRGQWARQWVHETASARRSRSLQSLGPTSNMISLEPYGSSSCLYGDCCPACLEEQQLAKSAYARPRSGAAKRQLAKRRQGRQNAQPQQQQQQQQQKQLQQQLEPSRRAALMSLEDVSPSATSGASSGGSSVSSLSPSSPLEPEASWWLRRRPSPDSPAFQPMGPPNQRQQQNHRHHRLHPHHHHHQHPHQHERLVNAPLPPSPRRSRRPNTPETLRHLSVAQHASGAPQLANPGTRLPEAQVQQTRQVAGLTGRWIGGGQSSSPVGRAGSSQQRPLAGKPASSQITTSFLGASSANSSIASVNRPLKSTSSGQHPLVSAMINLPPMERGLAHSHEDRLRLGLTGILPAAVQDQNLQVRAVMNFIENCPDELCKYIYLRHLKDFNEHLFYAALTQNVEKLMPIVYTPTVGLACQKFSEIYVRPRGLFVTADDSGRVARVLANWPERDVRVIVVTDGERILGLGDLGANGMGISIGKLSLYTALAGIPPRNVLPVTIDVGTNNETYLKDPFYIGLRRPRLRGAPYEALLDEFMQAVVERWGRSCLVQFEDFANSTAFNLLQKYRNQCCTFNDDIQGTASVCLAGLVSAAKLTQRRLADCSFLFYGAGEANLGTANLLVMAMLEEGLTRLEASRRIWLVDSKGLVVSGRQDLNEHKRQFAQDVDQASVGKSLEEIVEFTKPSAIIGASAQGNAFSESVCRKMASFNERPIIFALSNPTSKAECTAEQAYRWTNGQCVFASGSPFDPVQYGDKTFVIGQGNNAYIFPAVGLAAIAAHVQSIPEDTFLVAARALADQVAPDDTNVGLIYPRLDRIREVTLRVACRVLEHFYTERLATYRPEPEDKLSFLKSIQYDCEYDRVS